MFVKRGVRFAKGMPNSKTFRVVVINVDLRHAPDRKYGASYKITSMVSIAVELAFPIDRASALA